MASGSADRIDRSAIACFWTCVYTCGLCDVFPLVFCTKPVWYDTNTYHGLFGHYQIHTMVFTGIHLDSIGIGKYQIPNTKYQVKLGFTLTSRTHEVSLYQSSSSKQQEAVAPDVRVTTK